MPSIRYSWMTVPQLTEERAMASMGAAQGRWAARHSTRSWRSILMPDLDTKPLSIVTETLEAVFRPHSIAVIGASHHAGVGAATLRNLLLHEFDGLVYAVNRSGGVIQCLPAYHDEIGRASCRERV